MWFPWSTKYIFKKEHYQRLKNGEFHRTFKLYDMGPGMQLYLACAGP